MENGKERSVLENTKALSGSKTTNANTTADEPVFEYRRCDMQWYRDHRKQNAEFDAMIDRVTRITELIEQKVEQIQKNANINQKRQSQTKEG